MIHSLRLSIAGAVLAAAPLIAQEPMEPTPPAEPQAREGRAGVGFQFTWPTYGLSGMYDLDDEWSVQAVFGIAGFGLSITGRGLYRFERQDQYRPFAYVELGRWSDYGAWGTVPHFGFGGGVEVDVRDFIPDAPALYATFEGGLNLGFHRDPELGSRNALRLQIGPSLHYRF
jgi:hypothetical protein